jgi:hypothetical protein
VIVDDPIAELKKSNADLALIRVEASGLIYWSGLEVVGNAQLRFVYNRGES